MSKQYESHWLEREDCGEVTVVRLRTPRILDEEILRAVFDPIYSLVSGVGRNKLILNFAAVEYLPSLGLGKLVMLNRKVQAGNGRLTLCHLCPAVAEVLDSTHLTPLFHIYPTEQEALQSFC